jgi:hypothetical protein
MTYGTLGPFASVFKENKLLRSHKTAKSRIFSVFFSCCIVGRIRNMYKKMEKRRLPVTFLKAGREKSPPKTTEMRVRLPGWSGGVEVGCNV